jgi:hypothetical protein
MNTSSSFGGFTKDWPMKMNPLLFENLDEAIGERSWLFD